MDKKEVTDNKKTRMRGFTLVETAILIVIGSSILTIALTNLNTHLQEQKYKATREKMVMIDEGIRRYLEENERLPCVATYADGLDTETFGLELSTPDNNGCPPPPLPAGVLQSPDNNVYVGMVPVRTLNLPDEFALDGWGGRITYAVTLSRSRQDTYEANVGAITVLGDNDTTVLANRVDYILISHGASNTGSYSSAGIKKGNCPGGTLDSANCDADSVFRKALFTNLLNSAANFDDIVLYPDPLGDPAILPSMAVLPFKRDGKQNCPLGWTRYDPQPAGLNTNYIYCRKL